MGRRRHCLGFAAIVAGLLGLALPAVVAAHPLGNFTINHFAELRVAPDRIDLDIVIDMAEIPTFQERQRMDGDEDGSVSDDEAADWASARCTSLAAELDLRVAGAATSLIGTRSSVSFPPGAGGLSTLRLECPYRAALTAPIGGDPVAVMFTDGSYAERIGWREILATGVGTVLETNGLPATSPSARLTAYPADQLATPLDIRSATIAARLDPRSSSAPTPAPAATSGSAVPAGGGAIPVGAPGGVAGEIPSIFRSVDLTLLVLLASLATAVGIGAVHALTPGHGKTLMAAYLVGSRGTAIHAIGLGLSVAVSHTLGIFVLALVILFAGSVLPPDVVYRVMPVIAAVSILVIGAWMLISEVRRRRSTPVAPAHDHDDDHHHHEEHEHSHGGVRHSHLPPAGAALSWRGLFVLGLTGGLVPSTSALVVLLAAIELGRPAFGLVLVVAFGLGMAAVMTGVGLAMIVARGRLDRMPRASSLGRLAVAAPLLASVAVLGLGLVLTWQALAGSPVL